MAHKEAEPGLETIQGKSGNHDGNIAIAGVQAGVVAIPGIAHMPKKILADCAKGVNYA